ncbi:MAG: type II secretion system F family protein [Phycisphaeraceae bacterium]|nr:type II secretion system F family protein [Phycisphaeraceae bacterium]
MKLAYQAYDRGGKTVRDTIEAGSRSEASELLRRQGLFVTDMHEAGTRVAPGKGKRKLGLKGGRMKNLAMFTRQLYVLSSTGTPITESLAALERQTRDARWKGVIADLRRGVEQGEPISQAMAHHNECFDEVYRSLIAAGETGGKLSPMLDRLSQLVSKQLKTRSSLIGALVYPALLLFVSGAVLIAMLTFVLPRFAVLFETLDMELPPLTKILMALSYALRTYWWAILIGLGVLGGGVFFYVRSAAGVRALETVLIRLPMFGAMIRGFITARIVRLLGVLVDSYVPLLDALDLTKAAASNHHYAALIDRAKEAVTRGEPMSDAFSDERLISPSVFEAIRSGESTGQVSVMMLNMAEFMDEENEVVLKTLTSILEPLILVGLGVVVGAVALSMFLPLFDLTAQTGAG